MALWMPASRVSAMAGIGAEEREEADAVEGECGTCSAERGEELNSAGDIGGCNDVDVAVAVVAGLTRGDAVMMGMAAAVSMGERGMVTDVTGGGCGDESCSGEVSPPDVVTGGITPTCNMSIDIMTCVAT